MAAISAIGVTLLKVRAAAENNDPPPLFIQNSLVALSLSEFVALMGFVNAMNSTPSISLYVPYAAVTLAINLGLILPFGLAYWASQDRPGDA